MEDRLVSICGLGDAEVEKIFEQRTREALAEPRRFEWHRAVNHIDESRQDRDAAPLLLRTQPRSRKSSRAEKRREPVVGKEVPVVADRAKGHVSSPGRRTEHRAARARRR